VVPASKNKPSGLDEQSFVPDTITSAKTVQTRDESSPGISPVIIVALIAVGLVVIAGLLFLIYRYQRKIRSRYLDMNESGLQFENSLREQKVRENTYRAPPPPPPRQKKKKKKPKRVHAHLKPSDDSILLDMAMTRNDQGSALDLDVVRGDYPRAFKSSLPARELSRGTMLFRRYE
jgi:hypothetical protein